MSGLVFRGLLLAWGRIVGQVMKRGASGSQDGEQTQQVEGEDQEEEQQQEQRTWTPSSGTGEGGTDRMSTTIHCRLALLGCILLCVGVTIEGS